MASLGGHSFSIYDGLLPYIYLNYNVHLKKVNIKVFYMLTVCVKV